MASSIAQKTGREKVFQPDFEELFEKSLNGYLFATPDGTILRINQRLAEWVGHDKDEIIGSPLTDLLTEEGRKTFESQLSPLFRIQGFFEEMALELTGQRGDKLPVFVNGQEHKDEKGKPLSFRMTFFKGTDRVRHEQILRDARNMAEGSLIDERQSSALREQFIAVLSHDLRNPLGAISGGAQLLAKLPLNERGKSIVELIQASANRMSELINDVMDFARGRLGGGITLSRESVLLEPILTHVISELQTAKPTRMIKAEFTLSNPVDCDPVRLSQLLSNLVANALTHGSVDGEVEVEGYILHGVLKLSVRNTGNPISPTALERLFQPFTHDDIRPSKQGLGLGLYIANQVALAHGGTLTATSSDKETCFTFIMPIAVDNS